MLLHNLPVFTNIIHVVKITKGKLTPETLAALSFLWCIVRFKCRNTYGIT